MGNEKMADIEISKITPSKTNPRKAKDAGKMNELEDSIREKGVLQPIVVRPVKDGYEIVCGERRFTAAKKVGLSTVPAVIRSLDDKAVLEIQLIENAQRADVHPLEEAEGYEQLMKKHGYSGAEEIAAKVGKSKSYVYQRMKLCDLVQDCRKMFYDGKLTPSTALLIARMPKDVQKEAAKAITEDRWEGVMSLKDAHDHIERNFMLELKDVAFSKDDKICPERGSCATCQKRTGNQDALFPDIKEGDRCTDAVCFNAKKKALIDRQTAKAKSMGFDVAKTEDVFQHGNHVSNGWIDLKDKNYADEKNRTYREIIKGHKTFRMTLAVDPNGNIREVAKDKEVKKALQEVGFKSGSGSRHDGKSVADERREKEIKDAIHSRVTDECMRLVKIDLKQSFWTVIAKHVSLYDEVQAFIAKRLVPGTKRNDAREVVEKHVEGLDAEQARLFVIETYIASQYLATSSELCKLYKINEKAIEKQVRADMAKPKAKAKK